MSSSSLSQSSDLDSDREQVQVFQTGQNFVEHPEANLTVEPSEF